MSNAEQTTKQLFHGLADLRQRIAELDRTEQDEQQSLKAELEKTRKALETRMAERTAALQRLQQANERLQAEIIQRTQAEQHLATQVARMQTLTRLNQLISSPLDMNHLLREIARAAYRLMDTSIVTL
jgi:septal ring factor EnvC (AmiA/AmiB activator)